MSKGKVSKNSRTSKTTVNVVKKAVKPKKETIMIHVTEEVRKQLASEYDEVNDKQTYQGK